ncbi:hypothetical protein SAMD00019534_115620, partial [Acytostelium subglobosum LB1]|uniref:hypothetical protein n=1 Tax=Acytostelium subglobosum LB1 TaxID=1410327 RepID=UPI0006450792
MINQKDIIPLKQITFFFLYLPTSIDDIIHVVFIKPLSDDSLLFSRTLTKCSWSNVSKPMETNTWTWTWT